MQREQQIKAIQGAPARVSACFGAWIADPNVTKLLKEFHEHTRQLKLERHRAKA